jgi:hypothetical protein
MGMRESYYGRIAIPVAGAERIYFRLVFPVDVVGDSVGVRTYLHSSEGNAGSRESVTHSCSSDERVYISGQVFVQLRIAAACYHACRSDGTHDLTFHFDSGFLRF